jgi:hypothetical protein
MNEQIKQLALRAEDYAFDESKKLESSVELVFKNRVFFKSFKEKFGELIILECANRVNGMVVMDKGHIPQDPHSQGWNSAVAYAGKELKKHFGVE